MMETKTKKKSKGLATPKPLATLTPQATQTKPTLLAILMSLAMVFTMMPMMGQTAYAYTATLELDGGSYTLTGDNLLVKDGTSGEKINIHSDQDITFKGNTEIKLNGYKLMCESIKSGFENPSDPDIGKHPWYSYDLTIDGGDEGGSIQIGDPDMDDYALTANNLAIRNLSEESIVACLRDSGNKVAIYAKNDLRIEGIKNKFGICGAIGMEARDGITNISDVSGSMQVNAMSRGIDTDDTNNNTIKISSSNVVIEVDDWDGNCINSGYKKGGISITDSIVKMSNSNNNEPTSTSKGGYNALSASGTVNIKDSYVTAENRQKDRPAMLVYEDTGKLIISGESMLGCQNVEGGSASALMANAIELKDSNRLFMPKDGYIGKTKYNGGSGEKEMYTVLDKDGNNTNKVGFGSGKEVINTVSAPSKVFPGTPIHMSGVLKDENGDPVPNGSLWIKCEKTSEEMVITDDQGMWKYEGDRFEFSDPGEVTFEIYFEGVFNNEKLLAKDFVRYLPQQESPGVKVQVISEGYVETLAELKLADPPEGESRKTEYKCGEEFDLDASYVQAIIKREEATGETTSEARPLDPSATTITPSVLKHGTDKVSISYMFEGATASINYPVTVAHDWKEATCTEPKTCKGCGTTEGEALGHKYGAWTNLDATQHQRVCEHDANHIEKENHEWDAGKVTTPATTTATGVKTFTCETCKATRTETIDKLVKKANPLNIKAKTASVKYSKLKKKAQTISRAKAIIVSGAQGALTYQKASVTYTKAKSDKMSKKALKKYKKQAAKKITISASTGKITLKKGLKKGIYKIKVNVKAAGDENYEASEWMEVTVKIKIK